MTTLPFPLSDEARAERDGCDCPPWVLRCIHLGDRRVMLVDWKKAGEGFWHRYHLCVDRRCADLGPDCSSAATFNSEADALAAFFEAERQLLDGGDA